MSLCFSSSLHTFWVAGVKQQVRPVTGVGLVVICEAGLTRSLVRVSMFTFDVVGAARGTFGIDAELVLAAGRALWDHWTKKVSYFAFAMTAEIRHF